MTTPAYSHTYTYSRVGVGDVIALDPAGGPYTISVSAPGGWTHQLYYTSDPLASVLEASKWLDFSDATIPAAARKVAVEVTAVSAQTPESDRLKVTVGSANYKAATGHRYTDSGANSHPLAPNATVYPDAWADAAIQFDLNHVPGSIWQNQARTTPADADGDPVAALTNLGTLSSFAGVSGGAAELEKPGAGGDAGQTMFGDLSEDLRGVPGLVLPSGSENLSWIVIGRINARPASGEAAIFNYGSGANEVALTLNSSGQFKAYLGGVGSSSTNPISNGTNFYARVATTTGTGTLVVSHDVTQYGHGSGFDVTSGMPLEILGDSFGGGAGADIEIAEFLFWDRRLFGAPDFGDIVAYVLAEYSITIAGVP